jgi:hypothetical protein
MIDYLVLAGKKLKFRRKSRLNAERVQRSCIGAQFWREKAEISARMLVKRRDQYMIDA